MTAVVVAALVEVAVEGGLRDSGWVPSSVYGITCKPVKIVAAAGRVATRELFFFADEANSSELLHISHP